ncbi:MAG: hypothetical protein KatS3mg131_0280 [Candidatus Tectimicrobiota bacterium]|nr:MAG: hypothetical protein KatS3mg131_0280 [Candidatus Tectomicrobia bacterium]
MQKAEPEEERWETPSLEWIHRVRWERQQERAGQPLQPLSHEEAKELAKQYGLELAWPTVAGRSGDVEEE